MDDEMKRRSLLTIVIDGLSSDTIISLIIAGLGRSFNRHMVNENFRPDNSFSCHFITAWSEM